jgi:hypothetical protein
MEICSNLNENFADSIPIIREDIEGLFFAAFYLSTTTKTKLGLFGHQGNIMPMPRR